MKEFIKSITKKIGIYNKIKKIKDNYKAKKRYAQCISKKIKFENRMQNKEKVCFILAGYKPFLYEIIFKRLKKFIDEDIEVCILSSGLYSEKLSNIAKENNWSYLSQKENNVSKIQNTAINLFKNAKYIYKLDEDIFITNNYFATLMKTMNDCEENGEYQVGFVAPTIPINGFGNVEVLKRFNLVQKYTQMFEKPKYTAGRNRMVENNPKVAKFFWGYKGYLPSIDKMNEIVQNDKFNYIACPIRFSIGAIMFKRTLWDEMNMFDVLKGSGMGSDEEQICKYCIASSKAIIVSKNSIVGHLSFGVQNKDMEQYFKENKAIFDIN